METKISIIIPTYKRKKNLLNLLDSLSGKIPKGTEILIIEQVEKNERVFLKKSNSLGLKVNYFYLESSSTSKAKNVGIKHAKGDIVVFFDDDVLLKTKLNSYKQAFANSKIAAVTGRSIAKGQDIEEKRRNTGKITLLGTFSDGYSSTIPQEIDTVIGCNVAWNRNVLLKLHGFDEQFTGNAIREESDLSLRAKKIGYKILFDPRVEVFHDRATSGGARKTEGRLKWYFDFFSNETYFFLKHRLNLLVPIILLTRIEWILRCMFGFGREVSLRSIATPILGIYDGYRKYRRLKYENRG